MNKKKKDLKTHKVSLCLSERALHQLIWMKEETSVHTLADVIRNSIAFTKYIINERNNGWKLVLTKGRRRKEIITFE